jgi:hypothetical protein
MLILKGEENEKKLAETGIDCLAKGANAGEYSHSLQGGQSAWTSRCC